MYNDVAQKSRHAESHKEPLDFRFPELVYHDFRLPDTLTHSCITSRVCVCVRAYISMF